MIVGSVLTVALGILLNEFAFGGGLQRISYDMLLAARPYVPADEVVLVYLDEASHEVLEQPFNAAWDRFIHAALINRLANSGAKAVAFDIVFSDPNPADPETDEILAEEIRRAGNVILAADNVRISGGGSKVFPPFELLRTNAVAMGSAEVAPDKDMIIRLHTPGAPIRLLDPLSWATAKFLQAEPIRNEAVQTRTRWLNYYGPANSLPHMSYFEALDTNIISEATFSNKVVFVGANILTRFAGDRKDEYRTPYTYWDPDNPFISGVEIQATAFLNLLRGDWLTRPSLGVERLIFVLSGILLGAGLVRLQPLMAVGAAIIAMAATWLACYGMFRYQLTWFPWLLVISQAGLALAWSVMFNTVQLIVQKRLIEQTLGMYLPPKLVKKFAGQRSLLKPGAEKQLLTILFTDIEGFTSISEGMDSDELAVMMNNYFEEAVSGCIHKTDGTVGKYIGDAILAFWNAPDRQENHALRACNAALLFRKKEANRKRPKLKTRIGIHTGEANVGNFGSTQRVDYTVFGENVNLASRLEGLNRFIGTRTVMSGETQESVGDQVVTRNVGRFRLKGFNKPVHVYELVGDRSVARESQPWREQFESALAAFNRRQFDKAEDGFKATLDLRADDGPSKYYLEQIPLLRGKTLPDDWDGEIELMEK